ncbi:hypothetical protein LguiA_015933 [Lonicera macranthoides]
MRILLGFHEVYVHLQSQSAETVRQVHRTGYHFQPKKHWINGPMIYKGIYHLFYQYNPKGAVWGNIVWAHSVSTDLINWKPLEPAIFPSEPFDKDGCWSGSATILPDDKPIILYTGIVALTPKPGSQVQNYAVPANYSDPYLTKWIKPDDNPVLKPTGENISAWRDPTTGWNVNGEWNILVGGRENNKGIAYLYKSKDFIKWTKAPHTLHEVDNTGMWECPDFFPVSTSGENGLDTSALGMVKHVLKVSLDATRFEYYTVGKYVPEKDKYIPDPTSIDGWAGLRYDYGNFYASKTFYDSNKNRRILWGWANESDTPEEDTAKGWAGIQAIPRKIWLDTSGKQLIQWPIEELETLRGEMTELKEVKLEKGLRTKVTEITAAQADVEATFSFASLDKAEPWDASWDKIDAETVCKQKGSTVEGGVGPFGFLTLASENLEEYTPVFFRVFKLSENTHKVLMCSDATRQRIIDHSVVESFGAGGKTCILSRVYPTLAVMDKAHLFLFNNGTELITADTVNAWSMKVPNEMN